MVDLLFVLILLSWLYLLIGCIFLTIATEMMKRPGYRPPRSQMWMIDRFGALGAAVALTLWLVLGWPALVALLIQAYRRKEEDS